MRNTMMKAFSSWINIEYKKYYLDSPKRGLRIIFHKNNNSSSAKFVCSFVHFLRKKYFFPIRCYLHLTTNEKYRSKSGGFCYGVFFPGQENRNGLPSIYLPVGQYEEKNGEFRLLFSLASLLTYYYQWYFMQEERTHRSLEIEATKMANQIIEEYINSDYSLLKKD